MKKIHFIDWLGHFANSYSVDTVSEALNKRYRNIRYTTDKEEYDYMGGMISGGNCIIREGLKTDVKYDIELFSYLREKANTNNKRVSLLDIDTCICGKTIEPWIFRGVREDTGNNIKEVLSFNIYASYHLISILDKLINEDNNNKVSKYRITDGNTIWKMMHNPVDIYFNSLDKELLEKVVSVIFPYLREEKSKEIVAIENPYGVKLPEGIYYNKYITEKVSISKYKNIAKYFPEFALEVLNIFKADLEIIPYYVLEKFQQELARDIDKIDKESIFRYIEIQKEKQFKKAIENLEKRTIEELNTSKQKKEAIENLEKRMIEELNSSKQKIEAFSSKYSKTK